MQHPPPGLTEDDLTARLADAYGIIARHLTFLPLGEEGWCYRVEAERNYFVKPNTSQTRTFLSVRE